MASVIGKDFAEPLLAAAAALSAEELKAALAALHRAEFIHEQAIYPVVEYSFKHPLTQEVALGSQLKERRRAVRRSRKSRVDSPRKKSTVESQQWEECGLSNLNSRSFDRAQNRPSTGR